MASRDLSNFPDVVYTEIQTGSRLADQPPPHRRRRYLALVLRLVRGQYIVRLVENIWNSTLAMLARQGRVMAPWVVGLVSMNVPSGSSIYPSTSTSPIPVNTPVVFHCLVNN